MRLSLCVYIKWPRRYVQAGIYRVALRLDGLQSDNGNALKDVLCVCVGVVVVGGGGGAAAYQ